MTMEIKMLRAIADAAIQMGAAMLAVVEDCEEQLAKRKAAGEAEDAIWQEPFAQSGQKTESGQKGNQEAQGASGTGESNTSTPAATRAPSAPTPPTSIEPKLTNEQKLTIVELRAFVAEKSTPENRPVIKEILTQHGVKKLTELKEEQYHSVLKAVRKACP